MGASTGEVRSASSVEDRFSELRLSIILLEWLSLVLFDVGDDLLVHLMGPNPRMPYGICGTQLSQEKKLNGEEWAWCMQFVR